MNAFPRWRRQAFIEADVRRNKWRKVIDDKMAAIIILQGWMDLQSCKWVDRLCRVYGGVFGFCSKDTTIIYNGNKIVITEDNDNVRFC